MRAIILSLMILAAAAAVPAAQGQSGDAPQAENARVEKKALAGPLAAEVKAWATKAEGLRGAADGARANDVLRGL